MAKFYFLDIVTDLSASNLVKHLLFINFFGGNKDIIGVEWTIPIEFFWYCLIPVIIEISKSIKIIILLILISYFMSTLPWTYYSLLPLPTNEAAEVVHFSPIPYAICFILGCFAFRIKSKLIQSNIKSNLAIMIVTLLIGLYIYTPLFILKIFENEIIFFSILSFMLLLFSSDKNFFTRFFFNNRFIQFCGVVSYGVYLAHLPVISFLQSFNFIIFDIPLARFIITIAITLIISAVTYKLIELPLITYGKLLANKL
jgi:peptidoglycan/LPS O-acetylase OafA/YrhL